MKRVGSGLEPPRLYNEKWERMNDRGKIFHKYFTDL